jgi:hypothetical protein
VLDILGTADACGLAVTQLVVKYHLALLSSLLLGGGTAVLITDFSGSQAGAPEILGTPDDGLSQLAARLARERRCFLSLSRDEVVAAARELQLEVEILEEQVWRWTFSPDLQYLCYSLILRKGAEPDARSCNLSTMESRIGAFMGRSGVPVLRQSSC